MDTTHMSRGRLVLTVAVLFLSSICTMGDIVVSPIANDFYSIYSDSPEWLVNIGITGPALVGIPFCLLSGWLCDHFNKKWLMVIGFAIFTVSAVFGAAITNVYYFIVTRCLATGVGWGLTNACAYSIFADLFPSDEMHGKIVGWYETFMGILSAVISIVAGIAAATGVWQDAFNVYLISIPILVLLVVLLPSMPPAISRMSEEERASDEASYVGWQKNVLFFCVKGFLVCVCYMVIMYMMSVYVSDANLGDEAFTGMIGSVTALCTAVASFAFGFVYKKMKASVYLPSLFIMAACFFGMSVVQTQASTLMFAGISAAAWPFFYCYFYTHITEIVPASKQGIATGLAAVCDGLASAGCSYLLTFSQQIAGVDSVIPVWPVMGYILLAVGIVSVCTYVYHHKKVAGGENGKNSLKPAEAAE